MDLLRLRGGWWSCGVFVLCPGSSPKLGSVMELRSLRTKAYYFDVRSLESKTCQMRLSPWLIWVRVLSRCALGGGRSFPRHGEPLSSSVVAAGCSGNHNSEDLASGKRNSRCNNVRDSGVDLDIQRGLLLDGGSRSGRLAAKNAGFKTTNGIMVWTRTALWFGFDDLGSSNLSRGSCKPFSASNSMQINNPYGQTIREPFI